MNTAFKTVVLLIAQLLLTSGVFAQLNKYTSTDLNLRSGPGVNYEVITTIPQGRSVAVAEVCDCAWIEVNYNGQIGYVSHKYLSNSQSVNDYSKQNTGVKYYTNSAGERVQSPTKYNSAPSGATALCRDGTYSFSRNRRGTCSHHGGVAKWLK